MTADDRIRLAALRRHYRQCKERGELVENYESVFLLKVIDDLLANKKEIQK